MPSETPEKQTVFTAHYRRTVQTQPYESQVVELGLSETLPTLYTPEEKKKYLKTLYDQLDVVGDRILLDVLKKKDPRS